MILLASLGAGLLVLAIGVVGALLVGPMLEPQLQAWVEEQTGRELRVEGGTRLVLWPAPGLLIEQATLPGGSGLARMPAIRLGELRLALRLGPLFAGRFEPRSILVRQGRLRWDGSTSQRPVEIGGIDLSAAVETDGQALIFEPLELAAGALRATGGLRVTALDESPVVVGALRLAELDLRRWMQGQALPRLPIGEETTWRQFHGRVGVQADAQGLSLEPVHWRVDETKIQGRVRAHYSTPLQVRFDLELDRLDLDPYLASRVREPPPGAAVARAGASAGGGSGETGEPDAEDPGPAQAQVPSPRPGASVPASPGAVPARSPQAPAQLHVQGVLDAGELVVGGLRLAPAELSLTTEPSRLRLDYRCDGFYRGALQGWVAVRPRAQTGRLVASAQGVELGPLLADLRDWSWLEGAAELDVDLTAAEFGAGDWRERLNGELAIAVRDGAVRGVDLVGLIAGAKTRAAGGVPDSARHAGFATPFTELSATASIDDGILTNKDLAGRSDHLTLTGRGTVDLAAERIDYRLRPVFVDPPQGRGLKELEGIPIPVRLSGPWSGPAWSVDLGAVLREAARRELEQEDGGLIRELEDRLGIDGLEEGLRNWLGQ